MIHCTLELKQALNIYISQLRNSFNTLDNETYKEDFLTEFKWKNLKLIKGQLEPLFYTTKVLEGNMDFKDSNCKASYN